MGIEVFFVPIAIGQLAHLGILVDINCSQTTPTSHSYTAPESGGEEDTCHSYFTKLESLPLNEHLSGLNVNQQPILL